MSIGEQVGPAEARTLLDGPCSKHFMFRDFVHCGETWKTCADRVGNLPLRRETWEGIRTLAVEVLDAVVDNFGRIDLSYGFCSPGLSRRIVSGISPSRDQHAGCEVDDRGRKICRR